jgi:hypothetical protein
MLLPKLKLALAAFARFPAAEHIRVCSVIALVALAVVVKPIYFVSCVDWFIHRLAVPSKPENYLPAIGARRRLLSTQRSRAGAN